ncbi:MAG: phage major tail protein, TP901-1 family [Desulfotomaculaceae bacterium]
MAKVAGVDVLVKIEDSATPGTYVTLGGQSGATLNRSTNTIDATSKDANGWAENLAGVNSWSIDCEGFIVASDAAYGDLEDAWEGRDTVNVQILMPSGKKYTGNAIITDFPNEYPQDGAATFSLSLTGTGTLAKVAS